MDFDKILEHIGGFRLYQLYQYILVGLVALPMAMQNLANVFVATVPEHWCNIPELKGLNLTRDEQRRITTPHGMSQQSACQIRDLDYSQININSLLNYTENSTTSHIVDCQQWQYDYSEVSYTTVSRWDLVCHASWKRAMATSIYMAGFLIGSVCFGYFSDRYGRKKTYLFTLLLLTISGLIAAFLPEYWIHVFCRMFTGAAIGGCFAIGFVIVMEIIGIHERMMPGLWYQGFCAAGYMLLAPIAYAITDYRYLLLTISLLPCLFLPYYWLLEESPRWLITKGKTGHAKRIIAKMAKINGRTVPEEMLVTVVPDLESQKITSQRKYTTIDLLRTPNMRKKSINLFFNWFVNSFVYYGLSFGVSVLEGSPHVNLVLSGAMEFPGFIIAGFTLNRFGRRWPLVLFMVFGGVACCTVPAIPERISWLRITLAMLGKFGISGSFAIIYIFSAELFPTVVRTIGVGTGSMHARLGSLIAPFVAELGILGGWEPLSMLIFGGSSILAGMLALLLPETMDQKLPETLEDGEKFGVKVEEVDKDNLGRMAISEKQRSLQ